MKAKSRERERERESKPKVAKQPKLRWKKIGYRKYESEMGIMYHMRFPMLPGCNGWYWKPMGWIDGQLVHGPYGSQKKGRKDIYERFLVKLAQANQQPATPLPEWQEYQRKD